MSSRKPRLLWISDAACPTGFATVSHNLLGWLGGQWERFVLGVNATGDPHGLPFPVYPARVGGDVWGFGRFIKLVCDLRPDVVVIQSDAWIITGFLDIAKSKAYGEALAEAELEKPPIVGYMPVDGAGMKRSTVAELSAGLAHAAFYTGFGREQALDAGLTCPSSVVGLGVRREVFQPIDKAEARKGMGGDLPPGAFLFGNVARNQPRKRLDLTLAWFADFLATDPNAGNCFLYLHCIREDVGFDLEELAHFYGITERMRWCRALTFEELVSESTMRFVYNALDVQISTTMGEGWGLPVLEGLACGVPQIVPEWAALADWARGAVHYVPVEPGAANFGFKAFGVGALPLKADFIAAMSRLRADGKYRAELAARGLAKAAEERFSWKYAAASIHEDLCGVLEKRREFKAA